jgi:peptidoglycan/xylan/chitin deacetylase (PgdA/CDA1 family)
MLPVVIVILVVLAATAALYARWRLRYRYPPPGIPQVLCYHKLSSRFCWEGTWTTPKRFFAAIDRLLDHGYCFIGEDEYLSVPAEDGGAPGRLFLTFDDGYAGVRSVAFDGLCARGVPFHVFLVSDYAGRPNDWDLGLGRRPFFHATWDEAREMALAGVTFGSHGASHRDLTKLPAERVRDELERSKRTIEGELGRAVRTVSYPFGRYDDVVRAAAAAAGYEAGFSLYPRHPNDRVDRFALRRNGVYIIDGARTVEAKLRRHRWFWFEEMKCRSINGVAVLTPLLKTRS